MNQLTPREAELVERLDWFVKLRWLFLLGLAALLFFAIQLFHLGLSLKPILIIAGIVLFYNTVFLAVHSLRNRSALRITSRGMRIEANLQIGLDLFFLVFLIHFSGGSENPFIFFFVFHMIMGSILLKGPDIWVQATVTIILLYLMLILSLLGIIDHHHIEGFASPDLWSNRPYAFAGMLAFAATLFLTVYMTNSIAGSVRARENELMLAKARLEQTAGELENVNRELIRQQTLLIQSEKLASLGKLSAGIAHELNSPLTGVLNFSHFIKDQAEDNEQILHDVGIVIRETERCKKIIKGLLDYARQSETEKRMNDVVAVLNRTIALVESHKDFKDVEITLDAGPDLPLVSFDRDQIQQVFMNLVVNAQEAMNGHGAINIKVRAAPDKRDIEIVFTDTGPGMDEQTIRKIFDPFFTTKEMGTGLGLSISMGIIEKHRGSLTVESSPGKGSSFRVTLPVNVEEETT